MVVKGGRTSGIGRLHVAVAAAAWLGLMTSTGVAAQAAAPRDSARVAQTAAPVDSMAVEQPTQPVRVEVPAPGVVQELELRDGSRLYGRVESVGVDTFVFRLVTGATIEVAHDDVVLLRVAQGAVDAARFWPADANATRLFFAPTGRALPRGEGYVGVYQVLLPFVQVGVTDRFSMGGGTPLVFGFDGGHPVWLTPKLQFYSSPRVQAATGVMHVVGVDGGQAGIAYGVVTAGSGDGAVTAGAGWGYRSGFDDDGYASNGDDDNGDALIVMLAAERRVSRRLKWITENYVFPDGGILSGGVRFIGDRLSADIALAAPLGTDGFFVWPVVNFVWTFEK
jgi:hypothetical protein